MRWENREDMKFFLRYVNAVVTVMRSLKYKIRSARSESLLEKLCIAKFMVVGYSLCFFSDIKTMHDK